MLDALENFSEFRDAFFFGRETGCADEGVQFIDCSVAIDPKGIFGNALAANEACLTFVAAASVNAVEREPWFVERVVVHVLYLMALAQA